MRIMPLVAKLQLSEELNADEQRRPGALPGPLGPRLRGGGDRRSVRGGKGARFGRAFEARGVP